MTDERIATNLRNWDERVADHLVAYGADAFADDASSLRADTEVELLAPHLPGGTLEGLDLVHLQCHIGTDSLSFARRGARVVGTDLSPAAVEAATRLAERAHLGDRARFVRSANEDAPRVLGRRFDVVVTSVGVLTWLPELAGWARAVAELLEDDGVFLVYDAHPMLSSLDAERDDGALVVERSYFSGGEPERFDDGLDYASDTRFVNATTYEWTHDLAEILGSLLAAGLEIVAFDEHRSIPWRALPSLVEGQHGWELPAGAPPIPLMFSLVARRRP